MSETLDNEQGQTRDDAKWRREVIRLAVGLVIATGTFLGGRGTQADTVEVARQVSTDTERAAIDRAATAVRVAVKSEMAPLRQDVNKLQGSVDALTKQLARTKGRVRVLEELGAGSRAARPASPRRTVRQP